MSQINDTGEPRAVSLEFKYESGDFSQLGKAVFPEKKRPKRNQNLSTRQFPGWIIFVPAAVALFVWIKQTNPSAPATSGDSSVAWHVITCVVVAVCVGIVALVIRLQFRIRFARDSSLGQRHTATIDTSGITLAGDTSSTRWTWSAFTGWLETDTVFILRQPGRSFVVIPKRGTTDPQKIEEVRSLIQKSAGEKLA